jgi:hypothetical protein
MLISLLLLFRDLGLMVYGGSLLAMTILIGCARAGVIPYIRLEDAVRVYRAWGPGLGLSMGAIVFFGLSHHYLGTGAFHWPLDAATTPAWVVLFLAWVSNLRLEVWTLDPLRKLDGEGGVGDTAAYREAAGTLLGHLVAQDLLIFATVVLFYWAERG